MLLCSFSFAGSSLLSQPLNFAMYWGSILSHLFSFLHFLPQCFLALNAFLVINPKFMFLSQIPSSMLTPFGFLTGISTNFQNGTPDLPPHLLRRSFLLSVNAIYILFVIQAQNLGVVLTSSSSNLHPILQKFYLLYLNYMQNHPSISTILV